MVIGLSGIESGRGVLFGVAIDRYTFPGRELRLEGIADAGLVPHRSLSSTIMPRISRNMAFCPSTRCAPEVST